MAGWLRLTFRASTVLLGFVCVAALLPHLGRSAPAEAQFGFGGQIGSFGATCPGIGGINFGGCTFGGGFGQFGSGGIGGIGGQFGGVGGAPFQGGFGGFVIATPEARIRPGQQVPLIFGWVVPPPAVWRDIESMEVRVRDREKIAVWVRWNEATNTLVLVDPKTGKPVGTPRPLGARGRLVGELASLDVGGSALEDSGPTGDHFALLLPLRFTTAAGGRRYQVEIGAGSDEGERFFATVAQLAVRRAS